MTDNTGRAHVRIEEDHHAMPLLALPPGLFVGTVQPKRVAIPNLPVGGFQVDALLTAAECNGLVSLAEATGLKSISWEYDPKYRSCTRLVVRMPELAAELWRRIRPLLQMPDIADARPFGYGVGPTDVWRPCGINEFTKYQKGDHFSRHRDGAFVVTDEQRSVHTVMVYLNENNVYEGGGTAFYAPDPAAACDTDVCEVASNRGEIGSALVFQHKVWHEGRPLDSGVKYILRTDLMFLRVATAPLSKALLYLDEPKYHEAEALYQKSITLQNAGDPAGSTAAYCAALEMHAALAACPPAYGPDDKLLPIDIMLAILKLLPLSDISRRVWCVSRGWRALARHPTLWKRFYISHIGGWASTDKQLVHYQLPQKIPLKDWYMLFRTHFVAKREFRVVYADLGSMYLRYGMLGEKNDEETDSKQLIPSLIMKIKGHYWGAAQGLSQHACGWNAIGLSPNAVSTSVISATGVSQVSVQVLLRWMFLSGFDRRLMPSEHPLLLSRPAEFTDADCTYVGGVSYLAFVDPAVCSLASIDCHSGLVISLGRYTLSVTAVHDAQVVARAQETYSDVLTHFHIVAGWPRGRGYSFEDNALPMTLAWCRAIETHLEPLMAHVVKQMSLLPSAIVDQIWQNTVLRGAYAEHLAPSWLEVIKAVSGGKVQKFAPHVGDCDISNPNADLAAPHATMDVLKGLQKLCSSVGRVQKFFASVEPAMLRFNRTLLLLLEPSTDEALHFWPFLQGWHYKTREAYDENRLTQKQIKVFTTVAELRAWWQAFEPQLHGAVRKGLVRVSFACKHSADPSAAAAASLLAWRNSLGVSLKDLPVMLWYKMGDRHNAVSKVDSGLFIIRHYDSGPWAAFAGSAPPNHQRWNVSDLRDVHKVQANFSHNPDPRGP